MSGASVMSLRRGLITSRCDTSHLLPCQSWRWLYSRSAHSINLPSHIHPLCELRTSRPQAPRPPTAKPPAGCNKARRTLDHFLKKDMALVKALRQYHFASGALEGRTQWKFQKSRILHKVLDVIALNMESTGRCLDFRDSMPVDQEFQHWDMNL